MEGPIQMQSAVRLPTPPPGESEPPTNGKRKYPSSRSPSPNRKRTPQFEKKSYPVVHAKVAAPEPTEEEKQAAAKAEYDRLLSARSGGTYIPPARLRALQAQITDKTSKEYQRMAWEALKKSINGLINKVNVSNIKFIVPELFSENLVRGRGLFCRSIMKAQAASLPFTPIYAAFAAIVNTKLPQVGELLIARLIVQFKKAFKRNDKAVCLSSTSFLAHLANQQVVHKMLVAQILLLLLHKPTDDSVEIAVGLTREVGQHLEEMSGAIALAVFDQFRNILHEQDLDKRVQYMIEVLFQVRKDKYKDNPAIRDELDLVEEEDQITHRTSLDDDFKVQDMLNVFKFDQQWEENEEAYKKLKAEILGENSDDEDEDSDESSEEDEQEVKEKEMEIKDQSNTDLVNLRRTIYLTIMSSIDFEECCHKLMKINLPVGQESELPSMIVECCSQERTYSKFYGLIGERFAKLNRLWSDLFEQAFAKYYDTIHRYESNKLRNIAKFFGHMLSSDATSWHALSIIHLNEEETTASSRIFIKILFEDLMESMGLPKLKERLSDPEYRESLTGIFPRDNPRNIRFSINYFTALKLGALTEESREVLAELSKIAPPAAKAIRDDSDSDSDSASSYTSSSYTRSSVSCSRSPRRGRERSYSSRSRSDSRSRSYDSRSRSRTPPRRSRRSASYDSRSRSRSYDSRSRSRTPPRRRSTSYDSRSPEPRSRRDRARSDSYSRSRSRTPPRRASPPSRRMQDLGIARPASRSRSPPRAIKAKAKVEPPRKVELKKERSPSPSSSESESESDSDSDSDSEISSSDSDPDSDSDSEESKSASPAPLPKTAKKAKKSKAKEAEPTPTPKEVKKSKGRQDVKEKTKAKEVVPEKAVEQKNEKEGKKDKEAKKLTASNYVNEKANKKGRATAADFL